MQLKKHPTTADPTKTMHAHPWYIPTAFRYLIDYKYTTIHV